VQLLVGAPVEQVSRMVDGHAMCEYVVRDVARSETEESSADDRASV
jgi:hypothetical protein